MPRINRRNVLIGLPLMALASCLRIEYVDDFKLRELLREQEKIQQEHLLQDIKGILENKIYLFTQTIYTQKDFEAREYHNRSGHGTIYLTDKGKYVLTSDHIVSYYGENHHTPYGMLERRMEILDTITRTEGQQVLERIATDEIKDFAVLKLPDDFEVPQYKVRLGDSSKLKELDKIYLLGDPHDLDYIIREGIISNQLAVRDVDPRDKKWHEGINVSILVDLGDSGSPVINQKGEIVGILKESHFGISGYISPIKWYIDAIRAYEAKHDKPQT